MEAAGAQSVPTADALLLAAGAAHWMERNVGPSVALLTVLAFTCYLRPGVAAKLAMEQLTPPLKQYKTGV